MNTLSAIYKCLQNKDVQRYAAGVAAATWKKIAPNYWYHYVLIHFLPLFSLPW